MKMFYKVQLHPSQIVAMYVRQCKQYVHQRVGKFKFISSEPHISLFSFEADEQNEPQLIKALRKASDQVARFKVALNGFSHYAQSKTIFLKVENADQVTHLNQLFYICFLTAAAEMGIEIVNEGVSDRPHLTIGSGFDNKDFVSLYGVFSNEKYRQEFSADQAVMLKYIGRGQNKVITRTPFSRNQEAAVSSHHRPSTPRPSGQMTLEF